MKFNNISTKNIFSIVDNNMVNDLPIKRQDVKLVGKMYGSIICALKGKMVKKKVDNIVTPMINIPK